MIIRDYRLAGYEIQLEHSHGTAYNLAVFHDGKLTSYRIGLPRAEATANYRALVDRIRQREYAKAARS